MKNVFSGLLLAALIMGCTATQPVAVESGFLNVKGKMKTRMAPGWSVLPVIQSFEDTITRDGPELNRIALWVHLADGTELLPPEFSSASTRPASGGVTPGTPVDQTVVRYEYRSKQSEAELQSLVRAVMAARGKKFESSISGTVFLGGTASRMEYSYVSPREDLAYKGVAVFAVRSNHLYLIDYSAPAFEFFARHSEYFEGLVKSATLN